MTDRELMQQALDALENNWLGTPRREVGEALRARLAQPEQEPVAWYEPESYSNVTIHKKWAKENGWLPLYTAPPQREWQGLTDEDRQEIDRWIEFKEAGGNEPVPAQKIITYVEAKLKAKNHD